MCLCACEEKSIILRLYCPPLMNFLSKKKTFLQFEKKNDLETTDGSLCRVVMFPQNNANPLILLKKCY